MNRAVRRSQLHRHSQRSPTPRREAKALTFLSLSSFFVKMDSLVNRSLGGPVDVMRLTRYARRTEQHHFATKSHAS